MERDAKALNVNICHVVASGTQPVKPAREEKRERLGRPTPLPQALGVLGPLELPDRPRLGWNAMRRMSPPHPGHSSGNSSSIRVISFAQTIREVSCKRGLSRESVRTTARTAQGDYESYLSVPAFNGLSQSEDHQPVAGVAPYRFP